MVKDGHLLFEFGDDDPITDTQSTASTAKSAPTQVAKPSTRAGSFQAAAGIQGRQFAEQCDTLLETLGFTLSNRLLLKDIGVEIDQDATSGSGQRIWFEYKGSVQGNRPGLRRTDTLKKAIANGALLADLDESCPYVVITSHLPKGGSGAAMLAAALRLGYFSDVICLYDTASLKRLKDL